VGKDSISKVQEMRLIISLLVNLCLEALLVHCGHCPPKLVFSYRLCRRRALFTDQHAFNCGHIGAWLNCSRSLMSQNCFFGISAAAFAAREVHDVRQTFPGGVKCEALEEFLEGHEVDVRENIPDRQIVYFIDYKNEEF